MAETEVKGIPSTEEVEVELSPIEKVGYINRWVKDKCEVKIRVFDDLEDLKTIHIYLGDVHVMSLLADKIEKGNSGLWFYRNENLTAYLPLDEMEDST